MKKNDDIPQVLGLPLLCGLSGTLLLMAACSVLVLRGTIGTGQIPAFALGCLAAGSLCAAVLAARRALRQRLLWGLAAGLCLFVCLVMLSLLWLGQPVSLPRVGIAFAVCALSALTGGMLGAGMKRKKRKS